MKPSNKAHASVICDEFTRTELLNFEKENIWRSWQPIMKRVLERSREMAPVYEEICDKLGYSFEGNIPLRLVLEAIWASGNEYSQTAISDKKDVEEKLTSLHDNIIRLSSELADKLSKQKELLEVEGFYRGDYLNVISAMSLAGCNNYHFTRWVENDLKTMKMRFDGKYWPSVAEFVQAIGSFEALQQPYDAEPVPRDVLNGQRPSLLKNYVLAVDSEIEENFQIPSGFKLSNKSLATIANIVLDISEDSLATSDSVRIIRHRSRKGAYEK